jgi:hypothetical protein
MAGIGQPDATGLFTPPGNQSVVDTLKRWDSWTIPYVVMPDLLSGFAATKSKGELKVSFDSDSFTLKLPAYASKDIADVVDAAALRNERSAEILAQAQSCLPFWASLVPMDRQQTPATLILLDCAYEFIKTLELRAKHELGCRRPWELSPQVQPMIPTPGHGGFPVGHAAEAALFAQLLKTLTRPARPSTSTYGHLVQQLDRLAHRIGENRVIAGVHFRCDLSPSYEFGAWVATVFQARCAGNGVLNELWTHSKQELRRRLWGK